MVIVGPMYQSVCSLRWYSMFARVSGLYIKKVTTKLNFFLFSRVHRKNSTFVKRVFEDYHNGKSVELNTALFSLVLNHKNGCNTASNLSRN